VHGDVSPKNILIGPDGPVLLDAECAWYGDPAFDLAFCLTHLLLKSVWNRAATRRYAACYDVFVQTYLAEVAWEPSAELEYRAATLLPALLLARIDGKSPVEYIVSEADRNLARRAAVGWLRAPPERLAIIGRLWQDAVDAQ
jgi:aminoglycoside phosphotransferase (APT) family kinase protein